MEENSANVPADVLPGYKSIGDYTQDGFKVLVEATRNANALPQDRNFDFYNAHESFRNLMNQESSTILRLINNIVKDQGITGSFINRDLEEKIEVIVDANDSIFERVAINLDEVNGIRKNPLPVKIVEVSATLPVSGSWNKIQNVKVNTSASEKQNATNTNSVRLITGHNIQRPQKFFKDRINNSNKFPWEPRIKDKPNSLKPLALFLEEDEAGDESFSHPYEFELERFEPSTSLLGPIEPVTPKDISETPLRMVETETELNSMLEDLRNYTELAVDLEHHSYRTFLGITCLMQISTVDTDYIIDTLVLRDKLWVLNEVFTKPTIVKIFHGAESDIQWLQRDLSLYVVNMFDSFQASKQLGYDQRSLKYLLKRFCNIDANKHFQLADWRMRPLPEELKTYAREDTHYLIYIYHKLRNELLELGNKNSHILKSVIQKSTDVCKIRYKKPILKDDSHLDLYRKYKKFFDKKQMYALKELYKWRDTISREEDESIGYILPNHMLLHISEILPREMQGILACCNPIPPLVRANLLEIHKIILKAREQSLVKSILSETSRSLGTVQTGVCLNVNNPLNCPHDLSHSKEIIDDLPTLLGEKLKQLNTKKESEIKTPISIKEPIQIEKTTPIFNVFEKIEESLKLLKKEANKKIKQFKFLGPYERYKLVKPYIQAEEDKKELLMKEKVPEKKLIEEMNGMVNIQIKNNESERKVSNQVDGTIKSQFDNNNQLTNDQLSDEERISRLHEHFKQVASEISQKIPSNKNRNRKQDVIPLRQMHGVKRKRSPSRNHVEDDKNTEEVLTIEQIAEPLTDVRPNPQHLNWSGKKRKRSFDDDVESEKLKTDGNQGDSNDQKKSKNSAKKLKFRKYKQKKRNQQNLQSNQPNLQPNQQNQQLNHQQNRDTNQQKNQHHQPNPSKLQQSNKTNQQPIQQSYQQPNHQQNQNKNVNRRQRSRKNKQNKNKNNEDSNFKAFDYSSVNFQQQFQGGAGSASNTTKFKPNFKAKNKSKIHGRGIGKGNNKSQFFGMNSSAGRGKNR